MNAQTDDKRTDLYCNEKEVRQKEKTGAKMYKLSNFKIIIINLTSIVSGR